MSIVRCYECERMIDLDQDSEVEYIDGEHYHWQCAIDIGLIEEEKTEKELDEMSIEELLAQLDQVNKKLGEAPLIHIRIENEEEDDDRN